MYVANINKIFDSYMKQCENVSKLLFTEKHILSSYSVLTMLDTFVQLLGHVCPIDWTNVSKIVCLIYLQYILFVQAVTSLRH